MAKMKNIMEHLRLGYQGQIPELRALRALVAKLPEQQLPDVPVPDGISVFDGKKSPLHQRCIHIITLMRH